MTATNEADYTDIFGGGDDEAPPDAADLYGQGEQPGPDDGTAKAQDEPSPKVHYKRESAAQWIAIAWGSAGRRLVTTGADIPVGRVMQFNAPLAGSRFDELLEGTFLDRLIQPLLRSADKAEGLGAVILLPALIGLYERRPELGPGIYPFARKLIETTLEDMAPVLKKERAERRKTAQTVADLSDIFEEMEIPKDHDPIDFILSGLLSPPPEQTADET